ncbi:MAG: hypothetical protein WAW60_00925 [Candidatus Saccharimonadales bacterium]
MTITTTQKIIKIGTSRGVTIPAKDLKALNADTGEELELIVRKKTAQTDSTDVLKTANSLLDRYNQDFSNLANR